MKAQAKTKTAVQKKHAAKRINWELHAPGLIAFFSPVFVMICIFIAKGIFPFGDRSFLRIDLYHQYAPFFQELNDKISSGDGLFYTWKVGLGTNFMALFAYYLASPLNLLLFIIPRTLTIEFITYGMVFKTGLASLFACYYLNKHNNTNSIGAAFFGIFYSLSGYMAAYSWNIMWLDCILLFPLIILGLERLVKEDKCFLYCISLGLSIFSNYYIAIMICITMVIYFVIQMILLPDKHANYPKKVLNFGLYSLLAGGLAAVVLLPEIAALSTTASGSVTFPRNPENYFSIVDMVARHLVNVEIHTGLDHWPNIYCGVAIFLFIPLYAINSKVSFKERMAFFLLILFFYLSFSLNILNFIWHGLHYPNSLPARQAFIYIFFLLAMGYQGFIGLKERTSKQLISVIWIAIAFVLVAQKVVTEKFFQWHSYYLSILLIAIYGGLIYSYCKKRTRRKKPVLLSCVTLVVIMLESATNMSYTSITTIDRTAYTADDEKIRSLVSDIQEKEGNTFFRVEKTANRTKNDGAWFDYPSASIFSSTAYADMTAFYKVLGMESSTNAYGTAGQSFASNMLLGVKYSISSSLLDDDEFRTKYSEKDGVYIYENKYTLPLGFMVNENLSEEWFTDDTNPGGNWNQLATLITGKSDSLFIPQLVDNNESTTATLTLAESGYTFLCVNKSAGPNKVTVTLPDGSTKNFENLNRGYFIALGNQEEGGIITVTNADTNKTTAGINMTAYVLDHDTLSDLYDELNDETLKTDQYSDSMIHGTVNTVEGGLLLTSIPYDKGWKVTVDGKEVETQKFEDALLAIPVGIGHHEIEMTFTPSGFYPGLMLTLASIVLLTAIYFFLSWLHKRQALQKNEDEYDYPDTDYEDELPEEFDALPDDSSAEEAAPAEELNSPAPDSFHPVPADEPESRKNELTDRTHPKTKATRMSENTEKNE